MKDYLGFKVKDKITGFTGIVTGQVRYLTGCNQVLVAAKAGTDGKAGECCWFDEQRVVVVNPHTKSITLDNSKTPGPDKQAPIR